MSVTFIGAGPGPDGGDCREDQQRQALAKLKGKGTRSKKHAFPVFAGFQSVVFRDVRHDRLRQNSEAGHGDP